MLSTSRTSLNAADDMTILGNINLRIRHSYVAHSHRNGQRRMSSVMHETRA